MGEGYFQLTLDKEANARHCVELGVDQTQDPRISAHSPSINFDPSTNVSPSFTFSINPPNQIVQCTPTGLWWDNTTIQGIPSFLGVIPGGDSFVIPEGHITDVPAQGTGFSWTPSL
ncbi:hypothetical protein BDN71DRAFT_1512319 [Pleurotus eryngii]|uniref:Uncharacterized protein n=1 Tax=Pleurotus eryngii TaxID=5323 RepID=A0A9P5ZMC8_PLEER|nr:hypothetical protein BDN71DRAFT_1512319 [Pleurotus eryngii]